MTNQSKPWHRRSAAVAFASMMATASPALAQTTLTMWSHEADQPAKVAWRELAARNFEKKNPGVQVKITWYQKEGLNAALKTSLRSGQGPDIFYIEPDQREYVDNKFVLPLDDLVDFRNIEPWARDVWIKDGKTYALPQEVFTVELYYNKDLMTKLGITLPPGKQPTQAAFLDIVRKAAAAGITPIAQGVGDRPVQGSTVAQESLMKKLGTDDYGKLLRGELSYNDPRVVETLNWFKQVVDAGAYPKSFATLKLGESHYYFHTKPGALSFPVGSWYTSRAFVPPDQGGQPKGFPLGVMHLPAMDGGKCPECKTLAVGASFSINAATKNPKLAAAMMNEMTTPEMGALWLSTSYLLTAIKADASALTGEYAEYFKELAALNKNAKYFIGIPINHMQGKCRDSWIQIMNTALPGGIIAVDKATEMMNAACYRG